MSRLTVHDKEFELNIPAEVIQERIGQLAAEISKDMEGDRPFFIVVLNGAFLFAADLFRRIPGACEIAFIRVSSYAGTSSSGHVKNVMGIDKDLSGRRVVIIEDIVDSGDTAVFLMEEIRKHGPTDIRFASLLFKPKALKQPFKPDYVGFEVENDFLVGYGLDYDGYGRNTDSIYKLIST